MFLSPSQRTFGDTMVWRIVVALPFFTLAGFALYDWYVTRQFSQWLWGLTAFFALLFIFALFWAARHRFSVHQEGIEYQSLFRSVSLRWDEIAETRYGQTPIKIAAHFGLLGLLIAAIAKKDGGMQRIFEIRGPQKVRLSSNLRDIEEAIRMVLAQVNPRMKADAEKMLSSGASVQFGPVSLNAEGVIWKQKSPVPYTSLVKCTIDGSNLKIKSEGKWLNDISVNAQKVPNIFVLMDLIEARRSLTNSQVMTAAVGGASVAKYV